MTSPWDVRPRQPSGDAVEATIYMNVGAALTQWEALESGLAELFDALVTGATSGLESNRAAFGAFRSVSSSSARTELVTSAAPRALMAWPDLEAEVIAFLQRVARFGARRNEIAHGMVLNLAEFGFYLCPNNLNPNKWSKAGEAKYQYIAADVRYYAEQFIDLRTECGRLVSAVFHRRMEDRSRPAAG